MYDLSVQYYVLHILHTRIPKYVYELTLIYIYTNTYTPI